MLLRVLSKDRDVALRPRRGQGNAVVLRSSAEDRWKCCDQGQERARERRASETAVESEMRLLLHTPLMESLQPFLAHK